MLSDSLKLCLSVHIHSVQGCREAELVVRVQFFLQPQTAMCAQDATLAWHLNRRNHARTPALHPSSGTVLDLLVVKP